MVQLSQLLQDLDLLPEQVLTLGQVLLCDRLDRNHVAWCLQQQQHKFQVQNLSYKRGNTIIEHEWLAWVVYISLFVFVLISGRLLEALCRMYGNQLDQVLLMRSRHGGASF